MARPAVPVGATWEAVVPPAPPGHAAGAVGRVWLDARHANGREVWRYQFALADGSGRESDWAPTRAKAVELFRSYFGSRGGPVRFRRVNDKGKA